MDVLRSQGEQGGLELKYQKPSKPNQLSWQGQLPLLGGFGLCLDQQTPKGGFVCGQAAFLKSFG